MILDTCFLIDLQRELQTEERGHAVAFLEAHASQPFAISVISVTEFLEGFARSVEGERLIRNFAHLQITSSIAREAARLRRGLRESGMLIGDFDILIAATALVESLPLVTSNEGHFGRVPGLELVLY